MNFNYEKVIPTLDITSIKEMSDISLFRNRDLASLNLQDMILLKTWFLVNSLCYSYYQSKLRCNQILNFRFDVWYGFSVFYSKSVCFGAETDLWNKNILCLWRLVWNFFFFCRMIFKTVKKLQNSDFRQKQHFLLWEKKS